MDVPSSSPEFFDWFRDATERAWVSYSPRDPLDPKFFGPDWQAGTRWRGGLSDGEIAEVENSWGITFPPDYRLFLTRLHTVDRPMKVGAFVGAERIVTTRPSFFDWKNDLEAIRSAFAWPLEGILLDIGNGLWPEGWGSPPPSMDERLAATRDRAKSAAPLIPMIGHRYLVGAPTEAGNPVLSVYQTDIVVYGRDLRTFLLTEFSSLLKTDGVEDHSPEPAKDVCFWGEFVG